MRRHILALTMSGLLAVLGLAVLRDGAGAAQRQAAAAVGGVTMKVATWNMCAEIGSCPKVTLADEQARATRLVSLVRDNGLTAVLVQQACEWQIQKAVNTLGAGWTSSFTTYRQFDNGSGAAGNTTWPGRHVRACNPGKWASAPRPFATASGTMGSTPQGYGVAILVKGTIDGAVTFGLPMPDTQWGYDASMLCVRKSDTEVRLCNAYFTPAGADPDGAYRRAQAARAQEIVTAYGDERIIVGGALEDFPRDGATATRRSPNLDPLYDTMRECGQTDTGADGDPANDLRAGADTTRFASGGNGKTDYLFVRSGGAFGHGLIGSCTVQKIDATSQPYTTHGAVIGAFTDI